MNRNDGKIDKKKERKKESKKERKKEKKRRKRKREEKRKEKRRDKEEKGKRGTIVSSLSFLQWTKLSPSLRSIIPKTFSRLFRFLPLHSVL